MMKDWKSILTWSGLGSFIGFAMAVALYSPTGSENFIYLIYAGMLLGAFLGFRHPLETRAAAYSFPLGFLVTSMLAGLWMVRDVKPDEVYIFLAAVMVTLVLIESRNFLDMFLVPLTYFGGFAVAMLVFKGYQPLQRTEGAVTSLFVVGVMGAILAFFAVFARWTFTKAKNIPRR
ncbi:hypothetical protein E3E35_03725 [Thermococcus sp. GR7]|uniref:hypothetical protein n=1 Tax=unclassified Thermococcus TaxID=2627626 RepID=UPI00142F85CD|nr:MULTISPECIES: hypothetical protein [unclassified Thermococcus]NJE46539.1 hypothetical protein [Thermococcus sp. GR7]NJE77541.1 hypothetical protein [Thermococcus sp. GR4]NJF23630.1 hypothetical protein [Thermococcus sp. GR5]